MKQTQQMRRGAGAAAAGGAPLTAACAGRAAALRVRHAAAAAPRTVACRAASVQQVDEEGMIDPMTGQVIAKTSALNPIAGYTLDVDGLTWAYRRNDPDAGAAAAATAASPDVLLLHGLGSSSYSYRNTLALLGAAGVPAVAADWPGHGDSGKPSASGKFDYSEAAYIASLDAFVAALDLQKPLALVVQGSVLPHYALLWAAQHPDIVSKLVILNTPLSKGAKLRPELAAYKNPVPFLRPKAGAPFDGATFAMAGSPYAMAEADAMAYARPYSGEGGAAASAAVAAAMAALPSWPDLLARVDAAYGRWRAPSLLLFGANDPFVPVGSSFEFLETKRTNMRTTTIAAKLGHQPQEDYADALHPPLLAFLRGEPLPGDTLRMTKRGVESS